MKMLAGLLPALALAATAQASEAPPATPALADTARLLTQRAGERCDPALDGDRSKGETTNADLAHVLLASAHVPATYGSYANPGVSAIWALLAQNESWTLCIDNRLKNASMHTVDGKPLPAATRPVAVFWARAGVISLAPDTRPDVRQGLHALDAFTGLLNRRDFAGEQGKIYVNLFRTGRHAEAELYNRFLLAQWNEPHGLLPSADSQRDPPNGRDEELTRHMPQPPLKSMSNQ